MLHLSKNARSSLLIVDMQNFFFQEPERRRNLSAVINNINQIIDHFEAYSLPVFHIISCYKADGSDWDLKMRAAAKPELIEGTQEAAILPGIKILNSHQKVVKTRYSAFFKTNLVELLQAKNIDRAVIVGAYTHYCVNATVFDAYCYNFVPCVIADAVISHLQNEAAVMIDRMRRNGYHLFTTQEFITDTGKI